MSAPRRTTTTSTEVARRAGVSRTTVSFVLNNVKRMGISDETRQRVLKAARELGYQPHAGARSLAGGGTGTVAVVIPRSDHLHVDAYLARLLSAVNDRCHKYGYRVLLESVATQGGQQFAASFPDLVRSKRIDGLIVVNIRQAERALVRRLWDQGFPVVVPGSGVEPFFTRHIDIDDQIYGHRVTRHLIDLGHRRIAHIGFATAEFEAVVLRRTGYQKALVEAGIAPDPALVAYADVSARSGYAAMQALLQRQVEFSAVFAGNDTVAFGAMHALHEAGLSVPCDVAMVGYDDIPLAAFASPPLTTLRTDPVTQGEEGVEMLVALMRGGKYQPLEEPYETTFVIRESCGYHAAKKFATD